MKQKIGECQLTGILMLGVVFMIVACKGNQKTQNEDETKADSTEVTRETTADKDEEPVITALDVKSFGFLGPVKESFIIRYEVTNLDDDVLEKGERYGLIRFGSCTEVVMPKSVEVLVKKGDKVKGGETIIGRVKSDDV